MLAKAGIIASSIAAAIAITFTPGCAVTSDSVDDERGPTEDVASTSSALDSRRPWQKTCDAFGVTKPKRYFVHTKNGRCSDRRGNGGHWRGKDAFEDAPGVDCIYKWDPRIGRDPDRDELEKIAKLADDGWPAGEHARFDIRADCAETRSSCTTALCAEVAGRHSDDRMMPGCPLCSAVRGDVLLVTLPASWAAKGETRHALVGNTVIEFEPDGEQVLRIPLDGLMNVGDGVPTMIDAPSPIE
jgi:hypothetical protein